MFDGLELKMTVVDFLEYLQTSGERPNYISRVRWYGMLRWYETRLKFRDGLYLE